MDKHSLRLSIVTPEGTTFQSDLVMSVTLPTEDGEITVLPNHIPIISTIKIGRIKFTLSDSNILYCAISKGVLEVRHNSEVVVLAERAEMADQIDIARAEEAYKRAMELKNRQKEDDDIDDARLNSMIDKELNRIKIGSNWKV